MIAVFRQEGDGITFAATSPTGNDALPTVNGRNPKTILVQVVIDESQTSSLGALFKTGNSSVTVTSTTGLYLAQGESVILECAGDTHIANLRVGSADENVHVIPLA